MATHRDFDGVYFSVQALRLYQDMHGVEILVVDNHGCAATRQFVENWTDGRYLLSRDVVGTAAPRDLIFRAARGDAVLCLDCHVLLVPGALARLKRYYRQHPDSFDLLQGPLLHDDLQTLGSHFEPVWRDHMWGVWALDERAGDPKGEPFDIPMQGLGLFSCRKEAWPGFHPRFRGFGGEEGYIHEKFRRLGRRCLCLPWLRWVHRFERPQGVPYPISLEDRIHNYLVGHDELGLDLRPIFRHFQQYTTPELLQRVAERSLGRKVDAADGRAAPGQGENNLGKWEPWYSGARQPRPFGSAATYQKAAEFLGELATIEDWGCGLGWFRKLVRPNQYHGLDGTPSPYADAVVDLRHYTSSTEGILLRHVLEHDHGWRRILDNALRSFQKRMCLVFSAPFAGKTQATHETEIGPGRRVPCYRFRRSDVTRRFRGVCSWSEERVGSETVFYLWK
jgi:hypothetical protein